MPELSIIIVSWNTRDLLRDCLLSIYRETKAISFEIFVVDNASSDNTQVLVTKEFPQVKLIKNKENVGFARANNQAITESKAEYILLQNPDTVVLSGALDTMLDFMEKHPQVGVIGPKLLNADRTLQLSARSFPTLRTAFFESFYLYKLFPHNKIIGKYYMSHWDHNDTRQVDWISGACLMARRKAIEEVGLLDEQFFMFSEEVDWCFRIRKAGWKVYFLPQAQVIHFRAKSVEPRSSRILIQLNKSSLLFFKKHYNHKRVCLLWLVLRLGLLARLVAWSVASLSSIKNRKTTASKVTTFWKTLISSWK